MNILKKELKQGVKSFLIWTAGLAFLILGGMVKFSGMEAAETGGAGMNEMLAQMPKPVLALFGMSEANIETLGGFFAVLQFYVMIVAACYAISLGSAAVLRETTDKTYEFLFTKPCGRMHILTMKLASGLCYLTVFGLLNYLFSLAAPGLYQIENSISQSMLLFSLAVYLIGIFFFCLGVFCAVMVPGAERAMQVSYAALLLSYGLSVLFDMDEALECLRPVTLFRYFRAAELLDGRLAAGYLVALLLASSLLLWGSYRGFWGKDLNAA